jgi:hypothetical protein
MALGLASPGIKVREVDLTRGGINAGTNVTAGISAPYQKGPVEEITRITSEAELVDNFGKPGLGTTDYHYESWYAGSNFLSYGGQLDVVRCDGANLKNANAGVGIASTTTLKIKNYSDYQDSYASATNFYWAAKNPGSWANDIRVAIIDNFADQEITVVDSTNLRVGYGVSQALSGVTIGIGTTAAATGFLDGIISGISSTKVYVKVLRTLVGISRTDVTYQENGLHSFKVGVTSFFDNGTALVSGVGTISAVTDWYNNQNVTTSVAEGGSDATTIKWSAVLPKPQSNAYVTDRGGRNDALNIAIIDNSGSISGQPGTILETFGNLSKAEDAQVSAAENVYYKDILADNSQYVYAGTSPAVWDSYHGTQAVPGGFNAGFSTATAGSWGQDSPRIFDSVGNQTYTLMYGKDYSGTNNEGQYKAELGNIINGYAKFEDPNESDIRFLLQGGGSLSKEEEQAKAQKLINIAESRKDCVAFISPDRGSLVGKTLAQQLTNTLSFHSPLASSSYAVLDSGYQYIYDRWNKQFIYMPTSNDVAGLCVRTDLNQFPWFSPAGTARGTLLNTIKLAYNPPQADRDRLYANRINSITAIPGSGIVLFGDKTALAYQSAFDRINVRRLFITIEKAIESAGRDQLFEFNDAGTRANFVNIVEPYLRDVQAKRGITDFRLICDESNNTPDVIDRNEFVADIYVKPARSINFVGLTFIATRTGVSFEEVIGNV